MKNPVRIHYRWFSSYEAYVTWYRLSFEGTELMLSRSEFEQRQS